MNKLMNRKWSTFISLVISRWRPTKAAAGRLRQSHRAELPAAERASATLELNLFASPGAEESAVNCDDAVLGSHRGEHRRQKPCVGALASRRPR